MRASIVIVGGGIGGLTAANALHQMGFAVRVFERAPELREVGAGFGLLSNAVRVLDEIGLGHTARELGYPLRRGSFATHRGRILTHLDFAEVLPAGAPPSYVVHRADLHRLLLRSLPDDMIVANADCSGCSQDGNGVTVHFSNHEDVRADILIGADGLHSVVRRTLWGDTPLRYSGQTCYRGIADYALREPDNLREVNGPGRRASVISIGGGRVYWWAALNAPANERDDPATRRERLLALYEGWPFDIPGAIAATPREAILRNDLVDRVPLRQWSRGRVTLLGDAAHPMQPNLGQGACTAIEDAYVISHALSRYESNLPFALQTYERLRQPRTTEIVNESWRFGIPVRWSHPLAVRARELITRLVPRRFLLAKFRRYIGYDVRTAIA